MSMIGAWAKFDQVTSPEADREESEGEVAAHCHVVPENVGICERDISCLQDSTSTMFNYVRFCNDCNDFKSLPALGGMFFSKDRCDRCGLARMMSHPWHWWWLGPRGEQNLLLYITVRHRDLLRIWRILKNEKNMKNQRFAKQQKSAEFDLRNVTKAPEADLAQRPVVGQPRPGREEDAVWPDWFTVPLQYQWRDPKGS